MANKKKYYPYRQVINETTMKQGNNFPVGGFMGLGCLSAIFIMVLACCLWAFPTMWLWNWLIPSIAGLAKIDALQALGLNFLCSILFKGNQTSTATETALTKLLDKWVC